VIGHRVQWVSKSLGAQHAEPVEMGDRPDAHSRPTARASSSMTRCETPCPCRGGPRGPGARRRARPSNNGKVHRWSPRPDAGRPRCSSTGPGAHRPHEARIRRGDRTRSRSAGAMAPHLLWHPVEHPTSEHGTYAALRHRLGHRVQVAERHEDVRITKHVVPLRSISRQGGGRRRRPLFRERRVETCRAYVTAPGEVERSSGNEAPLRCSKVWTWVFTYPAGGEIRRPRRSCPRCGRPRYDAPSIPPPDRCP